MNNQELDKLKKEELEILDFFVDFCKKNNLKYFLAGGTCLGAVRHSGFIPWDDDIDVAMPREDYEKLEKIIPQFCDESDRFFFQSSKTDENYNSFYAKLRKNGTLAMEKNSMGNHNGIWIDIFILDTVRHKRGVQKLIVFLMYWSLKGIYNNISKVFCRRKILELIEKIRKIGDCINGKYCVDYGSPYPVEITTMPVEWYGEGVYMKFEGKDYRVPKEYKKYLTQLYGDYMRIPSPEERKTHNIIKLEFNKD